MILRYRVNLVIPYIFLTVLENLEFVVLTMNLIFIFTRFHSHKTTFVMVFDVC